MGDPGKSVEEVNCEYLILGTGRGLPLVLMEESHPEDCNDPADEGDDNDPYNNGHTAPADGRQHLTSNDAVNCAVANHQNDVQEAWYLRGPVAHEVTRHYLYVVSSEGHTHRVRV